jgi:eukaryotic-like serine/threonine-protein kinase
MWPESGEIGDRDVEGDIMTTATMQCPNAACGRVSRLRDDPLGRIFRCPHCLRKLPAASASAADSGWTAIVGPLRLGGGGLGSRSIQTQRWAQTGLAATETIDQAWKSLVLGSDEVLVDGFDLESACRCTADRHSDSILELDESGEVLILPVLADDGSDSAWGITSKSSISTVAGDRSILRSVGSHLLPAIDVALGRFRILSLLGEGEHATVYRAYDPILERDVALKVPRHAVLKTAKVLDRFLGEAKALARLRHPRIVPVYEASCVGERRYIAMALIEGRSLAEQLAERPIALDRAVEIVAELAEALAYAHTQGVVHRDVKPANIRVDDHGAVYLMDFGIAYRPDSGEVALPPGMILGTPAYLAPEQAEGGQTSVLPASDQYSLGVVFYELLCGRPPFCGPPSYVLFHTIHQAPPSPRTVAPRVPRSLAAICLKTLAKRPDRRYSDCQYLADDLRRWLRGETPRAYRRAWAQLRG